LDSTLKEKKNDKIFNDILQLELKKKRRLGSFIDLTFITVPVYNNK